MVLEKYREKLTTTTTKNPYNASMFLASLFTIASGGKVSKHPLTMCRSTKTWHVHKWSIIYAQKRMKYMLNIHKLWKHTKWKKSAGGTIAAGAPTIRHRNIRVLIWVPATWKGSRQLSKYLGPYHPPTRPRWHPRFLASAWPALAVASIWKLNWWMKMSISPFLLVTLSSKHIKLKKKKKSQAKRPYTVQPLL